MKLNKGRIEFETAQAQGEFGYVKGEAKWAQVLEADQFGNFSINMSGMYVDDLKGKLELMQNAAYQEVIDAGKEATKAPLYKNKDGETFINFKLPEINIYKNNIANKIIIYDASGDIIADWGKLIGNGSVVKIKYRITPYYMQSTKQVGISYKFYAVQVIKLVKYAPGKDSGFGDETDGNTGFGYDDKNVEAQTQAGTVDTSEDIPF